MYTAFAQKAPNNKRNSDDLGLDYVIPLNAPSADAPRTGDLKRQILSHRHRLMLLEEQKAKFGSLHAPPYLITDIEETKNKIEILQIEISTAENDLS